MKKLLFLFILFGLSKFNFAQAKSDTLNVYQLSEKQKTEWDSIEKVWIKTFYSPFLKKNKIKISCAKCTGVSMVMILVIHEDGHCHPKLISGRKCGYDYTKKELDEIEKSFMKIFFSEQFYNSTLKLYLGSVLKC